MSVYYRGLPTWRDLRPLFWGCFTALGDMIVVVACYVAAFLIRFYYEPFIKVFPASKGVPPISDFKTAWMVVVFMWLLAISWQGGYRRILISALDEIIRLFRAGVLGAILSMSGMFLYRDLSYSRLVFILGGIFSFFMLYGYRQLVKVLYLLWVRRNRRPVRVLILGGGRLLISLQKILEKHGDRAVLKKTQFEFSSLKNTIKRSRINEVLVAHPNMTHKEMVELAGFCEENGVKCRLLPDILEIRMGEIVIDDFLGVPTFQVKPISLHGTAFLFKRVVDILIASLVLGIFAVPFLIICFLIKVSSRGPVFYHHERIGYRGRPFQFMKFRTMVSNADDLLEDLKKKNDRVGSAFKMKEDPRITPFGKFLRRYSIDEIPQLINVLRGEMSLVGPRPQVIWETEFYDEWARKRLNVLPGITGLWQVSGRAELTFEEMIDLDIYYIEHWSPGLDIKIIFKTIPAILNAHGAY